MPPPIQILDVASIMRFVFYLPEYSGYPSLYHTTIVLLFSWWCCHRPFCFMQKWEKVRNIVGKR